MPNLNGQPPVQVFAQLAPVPELVLRSVDPGAGQRVRTCEGLDAFARPGGVFAVVKAAGPGRRRGPARVAPLEAHPPNRRTRFVDLSLSNTGLQVTRS